MTQFLDPEEDYLTIAAAEEQMSIRAQARQKELEEARNNLKGTCVAQHPLSTSPSRLFEPRHVIRHFIALIIFPLWFYST